MISVTGADNLHKIVVLNPKGGCGKTTLATNLASVYAQRGPPPTLIDCDPQGFCMHWLDRRPPERPAIHGIQSSTEVFQTEFSAPRIDPASTVAIFDLPAAIPHEQLHRYTYAADSVLLPIMPSEIDVYSATRFIAELLLDMQLDRRERKLAIVASRVRSKTKSYEMLMRFLTSLRIPMIATIRDSQNYIHASMQGLGISEMPRHKVADDLAPIYAIVTWLDRRRSPREEQRQAMIAQTAYRNAELRGFEGGDPFTDWLEAEREVEAILQMPHADRS